MSLAPSKKIKSGYIGVWSVPSLSKQNLWNMTLNHMPRVNYDFEKDRYRSRIQISKLKIIMTLTKIVMLVCFCCTTSAESLVSCKYHQSLKLHFFSFFLHWLSGYTKLSRQHVLHDPTCIFNAIYASIWVFPDGSVGKESACNTGDTGDTDSIPESGRSPDGGHGNLLQYSCPMDRGAWRATVHMFTKSWTWQKQLSMLACIHIHLHTHTHTCQSKCTEKYSE